MFRKIAAKYGTYDKLFTAHPARLAALLEALWVQLTQVKSGGGDFLEGMETVPRSVWNDLAPGLPVGTPPSPPLMWDHLVYAYMVENTRIFDIVERLLQAHVQKQRGFALSDASQAWLRATEELFFANTAPFSIAGPRSDVRPDPRASRRNAYYAMFGLDLNHGDSQNKPYPYAKPDGANRGFVSTQERLLSELWRAVVNAQNTSGKKDTDDEALRLLCEQLRDMLTLRRQRSLLNREEFWFTSTMAWMHMAVERNSPIVVDLELEATSTDERLMKLGARVGLPAHGKTRSFLALADQLSPFLAMVEMGRFATPGGVTMLYMDTEQRSSMQEIITHYSMATGRDLKASLVVATETRR